MRITHLLALALIPLACDKSDPPSPYAGLPFAPAGPDTAPDPSMPGPFQVGVRTLDLVDYSRINPTTGTYQTETTEVWYPAVQSVKGQTGKTYNVTTLLTASENEMLQADNISVPLLTTSAVENAAPDTEHGPYPLIVFSHGMCGMRWQSTYYTVPLASHGYIVVAPDHEGDTLDACIADEVAHGTYPPVTDFYISRPLDVMYEISYFEQTLASNDPPNPDLPTTDPLDGLIDKVQIGVTGHSYGALTALNVAAQDPRVKAIVPQAPTSIQIALLGIGEPPGYILKTPTMIQGAHDDHTLPFETNALPAFEGVATPRYLLDVTHGGHFTFSDLCQFDLASIASEIGFLNLTNVIDDGCGPPPVPTAAQAQPMIDNFAIGFFNMHLRGSTNSAGFLTQARADSLSPDVAVVTYDER